MVQHILEGISDAFFAIDDQWRLSHANAAARHLFDLTDDAATGQDFWQVLPSCMAIHFRSVLSHAREQGAAATGEGYFEQQGRWFEIRAYPHDGGLAIYVRDISRRKWAEEDLRRTKESLAHAQELAHVGSWDYEGSSGRYTWSDETYRILGYEPGEFPASREALLRAVHPEDRDTLAAMIAQGAMQVPVESAEGAEYEHRVMRANGEIRHIRGIARLFPATPERPAHVVGAIQDITEQKRAEEALFAATEEAQLANRAKSELLSRTSHEFRTPLNAILGFGQLLETEMDTQENRESVGQILKAGRGLLRLVDELLDIARAEEGRLALGSAPIQPEALVREVLDEVRPLAIAHQVELRADYTTFFAGSILGDQPRLRQVLLNLLTNAVKYNRAGGLVEVSCTARGDRFRLTVRDTGVGIGPATMEQLFFPFERGSAGEQGVEGTGLGLALTKALVEAMNGRIGASTVEGEGSTFWVELPLTMAAAGGQPVGAGRSERSDPIRPPLVLYIEDNAANIRLVERIIGKGRPETRIITADLGRLGLELAAEHQPDLILLDLNLPDISGSAVLSCLKADDATSHIPVVMITGDALPGQAERLGALGAAAYLTKPFQLPHFLGILEEILSRDPAAAATANRQRL